MLNGKRLLTLKAEYQKLKADCLKLNRHTTNYRDAMQKRKSIMLELMDSGLEATEALEILNSEGDKEGK